MTERERLIELISQVQYMGGLEGKLADHLLSNGVIVPPCKVGQTVYTNIAMQGWYSEINADLIRQKLFLWG